MARKGGGKIPGMDCVPRQIYLLGKGTITESATNTLFRTVTPSSPFVRVAPST